MFIFFSNHKHRRQEVPFRSWAWRGRASPCWTIGASMKTSFPMLFNCCGLRALHSSYRGRRTNFLATCDTQRMTLCSSPPYSRTSQSWKGRSFCSKVMWRWCSSACYCDKGSSDTKIWFWLILSFHIFLVGPLVPDQTRALWEWPQQVGTKVEEES